MSLRKDRTHQDLQGLNAALPDAFVSILEVDARGIAAHSFEIAETGTTQSLDYRIDVAFDDVPGGSPTYNVGLIAAATSLAAGIKALEESTLYCTAIRVMAENTTGGQVAAIRVDYNGRRANTSHDDS